MYCLATAVMVKKIGWPTLWSPKHFATWENFALKLHGILCIPTHIPSKHTLLPDTLYSSAQLFPWNTLLHGILYFLEHFSLSGPRWNVSRGAMCSKELSVSRSKVFQKTKCTDKQSVPGSKLCWWVKCSWEQDVLRSKMFSGAKYESAKCSQGAQCSGDQSVCQPKNKSGGLGF